MTMMAVLDEGRTAGALAAEPSRIAQIEIVRDFEAAAAAWRELESGDVFATPYQRYELLGAWQRNVGAQQGVAPYIVVARDCERRPLMLMPLGVAHCNGARVASFLGGKHCTFNMPLWRADAARAMDATDLEVLIAALRAQPDCPDMLALCQQPQSWWGQSNPMALLPHQPSVNQCPVLVMRPGAPPADRVSNSFRRRLKAKEKKYQALPGYRYRRVTEDSEIDAVLAAFFRIKPERMKAQGLPNVFAEPGTEAFVREACHANVGGGRAIDIHALVCDDEMIAMFAGVADRSRYSMMFNTYTLSENARYSPGLILMRHI
ncbi:GNAT family N-acetyltransferase, partial [Rhodopseudomonas sp. B29]|uniref:GNAT family N-acetyltransferase n=1 Tax=Rhodopseudomonas sp. B29 TaxID=95607 RepID=UPI0003B5711E